MTLDQHQPVAAQDEAWDPIVPDATAPVVNWPPPITPEQEALRQRARAFAEAELRPRAAIWDEEERFPDTSYAALRTAGLLGLTVPTEFGGGGRSVVDGCIVVEELARCCVSSAMVAQSFLNGPWRVILVLGTDEQRQRLLPGVAAGTRHFAIAMSEPGAGSAGTDLETVLEPTSDGFLLTGRKCWVTGGREADTIVVFCRAPGSTGPRGIGCVLVHRGAAGMPAPEVDPKMGFRGVAEASLRFEGVHIPPEDVIVLPDADSTRGAAILVNQFNPERCGNAAMSTGVAQAALDDSIAHLNRRQQFGRDLAEFQGLQWLIADMALDVEIARLLTYRAAATNDGGFPEQRATVMAKLHTSEMVQRVTNMAIQLHGARGYSRRWPLERYFRDGRGLAMGGGTTQVMRNLLGGITLGRRFSQRSS